MKKIIVTMKCIYTRIMNDVHSLKDLKYLWNKRIVEIEEILGTTDFNFSCPILKLLYSQYS